jgi:hypothetical protein
MESQQIFPGAPSSDQIGEVTIGFDKIYNMHRISGNTGTKRAYKDDWSNTRHWKGKMISLVKKNHELSGN